MNLKVEGRTAVVPAGQECVLEKTIGLDALTIEEGGTLAAPEGKMLTLTTEGVDSPIKPGKYQGNIVLTVTEEFPEIVDTFDVKKYRSALYIDQTGIDCERSVVDALIGGSWNKSEVADVAIHSEAADFTGMVFLDGEHSLKNIDINFNGNGRNDFAGIGTGIIATGKSHVVAENIKIRTRGMLRGAVLAADNGIIEVRNSEIAAYSCDPMETVSVDIREEAKSVPWMLGLYGNNRATNIVGSGTASYINCNIKSEKWGVLSVDGVDSPKVFGDMCVHLFAKDCRVSVMGDSGYGSYSIGATKSTFDHTVFNVPDYALICANEYAGSRFINSCEVNSGRFGIMWHQNQGGLLEIEDSVFNTGLTTFLVKGCYPKIQVKRGTLNTGNGVILQLMDLDDPGMGVSEMLTDRIKPIKDSEHKVTEANFTDCTIFNHDVKQYCTDMEATFEDMELAGDFYNGTTNACRVGMVFPEGEGGMTPQGEEPLHGDMPPLVGELPKEGKAPLGELPMEPPASTCVPVNMILHLKAVTLTGVISASTVKHRVDKITPDNRRELGMVSNTPSTVVNNGVIADLDSACTWNVTGDCYLSALEIAEGAVLQGVDGTSLTMKVNGADVPIGPGRYQGEIVLSVV